MAKTAQTAKAEKKSIFWIMQYSTPFLEVYESFKKKLGRKYRFVAPLEDRNPIGMLSKIIPEIIAADFVIADVSTIGYDAKDNKRPLYNGNVMFELGVAMAYRKNLIMISSATRKGLPFDISGYHVNEYVDSHLLMEKFIGEIRKILDNENTVYRNPVSDLDHTYTLITNSELEALKSASIANPNAMQSTTPPLDQLIAEAPHGHRLLVELFRACGIDYDAVRDVAQSIRETTPWLKDDVLERFCTMFDEI